MSLLTPQQRDRVFAERVARLAKAVGECSYPSEARLLQMEYEIATLQLGLLRATSALERVTALLEAKKHG